MSDKTYVRERQVEYWTSRQIEEFFLNTGHEILVYPIDMKVERYIPADFLYHVGGSVKLFGIQYKALYFNNGSDYWKISERQHKTLNHFPWIYYGFSDLKKTSDFRNSLYYLIICENGKLTPTRLNVKDLYQDKIFHCRWGKFYDKLINCEYGVCTNSKSELINLLSDYTTSLMNQESINDIVDVFAFNIESKKTVKLSSQLRPSSER